ncbi:response regulator [Bacillus sp. DTU_2020_1000418_1_SI_GHA_SEK_038]|uniref:response regulator transcription factor n=1 Tax=Bacillus sp. DTU_2020_1000418_1_SI_GHA_SEK_038 TaxID=3077585 RepID=UPI0028E28170|nr:response regulator [Bacillus sp. DTU_2020_1000418_1_SI_GHA_SEK_038]WNS76720.1 response regulator [Bacillus sp. DTU_2020_1000418_1_SI_GHA_SEK_038]
MENHLKVLICDDSALIRKKLRNILGVCQCKNIEEAQNGLEAVEKANSFKPDLIFMDIVMPEKDGIEALEEIKRNHPAMKVIMASSAGTQSHLKKALECGADDFIQKPITLEAITSIIEKAIKEEREDNAHV